MIFVVQLPSCVWLLRPHGLQHARPPCSSPSPQNGYWQVSYTSSKKLFEVMFANEPQSVLYRWRVITSVKSPLDPASPFSLGGHANLSSPESEQGRHLKALNLENGFGFGEPRSTWLFRTSLMKHYQVKTAYFASLTKWELPNCGNSPQISNFFTTVICVMVISPLSCYSVIVSGSHEPHPYQTANKRQILRVFWLLH